MSDNERFITGDLAIADYPVKWKQAKELAEHELEAALDAVGLAGWMLARQRYLELGGQYKDGHKC